MARTDSAATDDDDDFEPTNDYSSYWQSIPDPPTPNRETASTTLELSGSSSATGVVAASPSGSLEIHPQQERKRQSFAFRDVTNHAPISLKSNVSNNDAASNAKKIISSFSIYTEDNENVLRKEKRLRRQTMLLPRDNPSAMLPMANNDYPNACAMNCQSDDCTIINSKRIATNSMERMIQLVRKYQSLPHESRIHVAKEIESLSGYPMPGYVANNYYTESKEKFILKVQPIVQALEDRKQLDVLEAEESTRCRAMKIGKEGFCYYDVNTGEQIEAKEYKLRYATMLDEKRRKRKDVSTAADCFDNEWCRREEVAMTDKGFGVCDSNDDGRSIDDETDRREDIDDSNMDIEGLSMDESVMSLDESVVPDDSPLSDANEKAEHETCTSGEESPSNNIISIETDSNEDADGENNQHEFLHDDVSSSPHNPPAGLSGMPPSNNPLVLAARARLWLAIDTALATYSKEILEIQDGADSRSN